LTRPPGFRDPAGSTAAALLAEAGRDVLLVEKAAHPRFHIGESLLPRNTALFDRLGVTAQVAAVGVHKPGAEFVLDATGQSVAFPFCLGLDRRYTSSWQVPRAALDEILFRNAGARGARTMERTRVTAMEPGVAGGRAAVQATGADGEALQIAPRFVLDASGRDTFLAGKLGGKQANKRNSTAAVYAHYRGVERRQGELDGFISIHLAEDGWFWLIPLPDDTMSVGFVGDACVFRDRKGVSAQQLFLERIAASPSVAARMRGATLASEITSTANYSYRANTACGDGMLMIGDAFGFVDPMFSTGVLLAMTGGEMGAAAADAWLDDPVRGQRMAKRAGRDLARAMDRISWMIYRVNSPVLRGLFMAPRNALGMRDGLVSMLAGNLRTSARMIVPVAAFKTVYYVASGLYRLRQAMSRPA
jgi:flavin-dependent dehydrogenase